MRLSDILRLRSTQIVSIMPYRTLGKTGLKVPIISCGGESILKIKEKYKEAVELIQAAYQLGVKYYDTAAGYYPSEIRIGDALRGFRKNVIIATKTHDRTYSGSMHLLEKSLNNLKTDYIDIWQIHHIDRMGEVDEIFRPDGAMKALIEAREQGIVRYLGVTGHYDPKPLVEAINRFDYDTILMAINAADVHKHSFKINLLPEAVKKNLGIIAMKVCSRGRIFEPTYLNSMKDALEYVLTLPLSTAIIGHDNIKQLVENIRIAQEFKPLNEEQMKDLEDKTEKYAPLALFFRKDCEKFNPWWC